MTKTWAAIPDFWRNAAVSTILLCGIAGIQSARNFLFHLPHGQFPSRIIGIMRSHVIMYNPAVTGYYEILFAKTRGINGIEAIRPKEWTFRVARMQPNVPG